VMNSGECFMCAKEKWVWKMWMEYSEYVWKIYLAQTLVQIQCFFIDFLPG
jgi:hypothetical protein